MRQVWVVLRREYLERVKTKGFIIGTLAMPVLLIGFIGLTAFMGAQANRSEREISLIDFTGRIGDAVAERHGRGGVRHRGGRHRCGAGGTGPSRSPTRKSKAMSFSTT